MAIAFGEKPEHAFRVEDVAGELEVGGPRFGEGAGWAPIVRSKRDRFGLIMQPLAGGGRLDIGFALTVVALLFHRAIGGPRGWVSRFLPVRT